MRYHVELVSPGQDPLKALADFIRRCLDAGGAPLIKTKYITEKPGEVIVACLRAKEKVKGGTITGIPMDLWNKLKEAERGEKADTAIKYLKERGYL